MKKVLAVILSALIAVSLFAGCAPKAEAPAAPSDTASVDTPSEEAPAADALKDATLKVWGSQEDQEMLGKMIEDFKAAHPEAKLDITLGVVGEPDAKTKYLEDPTAAADVFAFANDQITDLVNSGALYEITKNKDAITAANLPGSIEASTVNGKLYAYPMTADNGYFMYYDKSVVSEEQVKTLDGILAAANAAGKKVFMDVSNGWYIASFFLGSGGKLTVADGKQVCDFNNANGLAAGEAIKAFTADPAFLTGDDAVLTGEFGASICAGVSGAWNADAIKAKLGDNYAATKLPTFTCGGNQVQMGSFAGYKLMGVNSTTASPVEAMALAEFLTNEANQVTRFETRKLGPSNIVAAGADAVKADVALNALALQSAFGTSQKDVLGAYWGPAEAFGTAMEAKDYSKSIQEMLDAMVKQIQEG